MASYFSRCWPYDKLSWYFIDTGASFLRFRAIIIWSTNYLGALGMINNSLENTEILDAQKHFHELQWDHWLRYELFTYQWWMLLGVLIIPWLIWWRLVDKARTGIILAYGLYIMFVVNVMDTIGINYQLWIYPIKLTPIIPLAISLDWSMLPIIHMLIYQYFPRWKTFIIVEIIFAALLAFVGEPFAEWLGIYLVLHWHHFWSFPIYVLKTVIGKWLIERMVYRPGNNKLC